MGTYLPKFLVGSVAALLALCPAIGRSASLDLRDELDLRRPPETPSSESGSLLDQDQLQVIEESLTLPVESIEAPPASKPATDLAGIDFANFQNDVYAVALRDESGLGLGLASSGGVALTGGFTTKDGMQVKVYYVRRVSETLSEAARDIGVSDLPVRTVGVTVGWKF